MPRLIYVIVATIHKSKEEGKDPESIQLNTTTPYGKVTKLKENITYTRDKRLAISQQVSTRLQVTDKTV